jgi:hypothetical protein
VKSKLQVVEVVEAEEAQALALPEHVQLSLGEIAGQAKEGLLTLGVSAGLAVLHETMEWEVERIVGPKGRHDREWTTRVDHEAARPYVGRGDARRSTGAGQPAAGADRGRQCGDPAGQLSGVRVTGSA